MIHIAACFFVLALVGCATESVSAPVRQSQTDSGREWWGKLQENDARLRERFKKIMPGMSPTRVRDLMGVDPQITPNNIWGFKLSMASDNRFAEINRMLLVMFEDGKVSKTEETYTCVETHLEK